MPSAEPAANGSTKQRQVGIVGKDGAQGAWGIAKGLAGPDATNDEINRVKNQLLSLNPELAKTVKSGQRYYVPESDTPENLLLARDADAVYQAQRAEKIGADLEAQRAYLNRNDAALRASVNEQFALGRLAAAQPSSPSVSTPSALSMPETDAMGNPTGWMIDVEAATQSPAGPQSMLSKNEIRPDGGRAAYVTDKGSFRDPKAGTYTSSPLKDSMPLGKKSYETEIVLAKWDDSGQLPWTKNPEVFSTLAQGKDYFVGAREFGDYKQEGKLVFTAKNGFIPTSIDAKFYSGIRYGVEYAQGTYTNSTSEVFGSKIGVNTEGSLTSGASANAELKASLKPGSPLGVVADVGGTAGADIAALRAQGKVEFPIKLGPVGLVPSVQLEGQALALGASAGVGFKTYETKIGGSMYVSAGLSALFGAKAKFALDWSFK